MSQVAKDLVEKASLTATEVYEKPHTSKMDDKPGVSATFANGIKDMAVGARRPQSAPSGGERVPGRDPGRDPEFADVTQSDRILARTEVLVTF